MFKVYIESAYGVKKEITEFEAESDAYNFCKDFDWEYVDENMFVWNMDYK